MNAVNLTGYISEHLNLRYTPNGNAVVSFNLAVKKPYKVEPGKQDADFFRIVAWGKLAENLVEYTKKGSLIQQRHQEIKAMFSHQKMNRTITMMTFQVTMTSLMMIYLFK